MGVLSAGIARRQLGREGGAHAPQPGLGARLSGAILRPTTRAYALTVSGVALLLALGSAILLQRRLLAGVDEMAELIHARFLAAGRLGGTLPGPLEAWLIPNTLVTEAGWVSQYPPGHMLAWAPFTWVGLGWAAGPVLFAVMAGLLAAAFDRLLAPEQRVPGRVAALLLAASPFAVLVAGGTPSHLTAGAAGALALYAALRASEGKGWAYAAGAAVGLMVLARPWTGILIGPTLTLGTWLERGGRTLTLRRLGPWLVGGAPFALFLFWYDATLFGSPFTLGYAALYGPSHDLGFHSDPWSFPYGLREAVAHSASDIIQLGAALLETPVSLTLVAAAYLVLAARLAPGASAVAAWALVPLFGNALYWFHAPRMLFEAAPAWILLAVLGVWRAHERAGPAVRWGIRWSMATALVIGVSAFLPLRIRSQAWPSETLQRIEVPDGAEGALVFVHGDWNERLAAMLQATGMRNDSIQAIVRRNDTCLLHGYAVGRLGGMPAASFLDIDRVQTSRVREGIATARAPGGVLLRLAPGTEWPRACVREAAADRFGSIALAPLLWQGDLPGLERGRPLFVRDLGPERNDLVRASFPDRPAMVFMYASEGAAPALIPYEQAMATLWQPRDP